MLCPLMKWCLHSAWYIKKYSKFILLQDFLWRTTMEYMALEKKLSTYLMRVSPCFWLSQFCITYVSNIKMLSVSYFSKYILLPVASIHLDLNLYLVKSKCDHISFSNTSQNVTDSNKISIMNKIKAHLTNFR